MGKASSEPTELVECATPPPPSPAWWKPYEDTPVPPLLRNYVAFRWLIMTPLQYEMISRPVRLTIGEVLALVPLMALLAVAIVSWDTGSSGSLAQPALIIAFVFAARNSPFTFLIGVPFERRIWYHKAAAFCSVLSGAAHLTIAYVKGNPRVKGTDYEWTGLVLIGCMGALVVTSFYIIRRKLFEIWYFLHWVLFLTLIPFAVMHGAGLILIGVGFWLLDVFFRNTYLTFFTLPKTAEFRSLPGDVVEVAFRNQNRTLLTEETPGSWYYLSVQRLGIFQFHPFSISSCPNSDVTTLHIRSTCRVEQKHQSSWTRQLLELVREEEAKVQAGSPVQLDVLLEGPYGSPSVDISGPTYKYFILGSGGIGLTPMVAVQRSLEQQAKRGRDVKKIWFHWSVRDELVQGCEEDLVPLVGEGRVGAGRSWSRAAGDRRHDRHHVLPDFKDSGQQRE
eukprot:TRINITY_DN11767_c0_g1_i3.p1 TRINITY_DN11767_c0_g1~~TRINITY_DN11767_c0_g1_i3.p1  ORF type:complete len:463 (+),score=80.71 TRINITY_DN11767_c0_g1_i3:45-1391(+)